jgi:hypothetical protein
VRWICGYSLPTSFLSTDLKRYQSLLGEIDDKLSAMSIPGLRMVSFDIRIFNLLTFIVAYEGPTR